VKKRQDIQALRAVAVVLVVVTHIWPDILKGGYVGVDVFFVISGFLITGVLIKKPIESSGDLLNFWARRIRRLFPSAIGSLLLALFLAILYAPPSIKNNLFLQIIASATYSQNWMLINNNQDYFAQDEEVSLVQHFWTLSVEEQFYIVWPLIFFAVLPLVKRKLSTKAYAIPMLSIFIASIIYSIYETAYRPEVAYFSTFSRMWELSIGGLLALLVRMYGQRREQIHEKTGDRIRKVIIKMRALIAWLGYATIVCSAIFFTSETPIPGYMALIPCLGTVLIIAANTDSVPFSPGKFLSIRPIQYIGEISYEIYLVHFILYMTVYYVAGRELPLRFRVSLLLLTFVSSTILRHTFSDSIRFSKSLVTSLKKTFIFGAASILIVTFISVGGNAIVTFIDDSQEAASRSRIATMSGDECYASKAAKNKECSFMGEELITSPIFAATDRSTVYKDNCENDLKSTNFISCTYGYKGQDYAAKIALLGNSHAIHWQSALNLVLKINKWQLELFGVSMCYTTLEVTEAMPSKNYTDVCREFNTWATDKIATGSFDLVIMSDIIGYKRVVNDQGQSVSDANNAIQKGFEAVINKFADAGKKVMVIKDTPVFTGSTVPDCVKKNWPNSMEECETKTPSEESDELFMAAKSVSESATNSHTNSQTLINPVNYNEYFCERGTCPGVIGGVIVYSDKSHITKTYAESLSSVLENDVKLILGR
jgi:peptidoglycan/LPS O-acetylase OafA/YrhL